jgi:hypothetical protein
LAKKNEMKHAWDAGARKKQARPVEFVLAEAPKQIHQQAQSLAGSGKKLFEGILRDQAAEPAE